MPRPKKILISGFGPFAEFKLNSSEWLVQQIGANEKYSASVSTCILPVEFEGGFQKLEKEILRHEPDVVIATGLAAGVRHIYLEDSANNLMDARFPDNQGYQPKGKKIDAGLPEKLPSRLPIKNLLVAANRKHPICKTSKSPGSYVCNDVMFRLLSYAESSELRCGFIHIPELQGLNDSPKAANPEVVLEGFEAILDFLIESPFI